MDGRVTSAALANPLDTDALPSGRPHHHAQAADANPLRTSFIQTWRLPALSPCLHVLYSLHRFLFSIFSIELKK